MDERTAVFIFGLLLVPAIGWAIAVLAILRDVKMKGDELLMMHRKADEFGFGTGALTDMVNEQRRLTQNVVHYLKWAAEKLTGEVPPPPLDVGE
jgi:hypothetical protein